jgi:hypothetical protein
VIGTVATVGEFVGTMLGINLASILDEDSPVEAALIITVFRDEHDKHIGAAAVGGSSLLLRKLADKMREVAAEIDAGKYDSVSLNASGGAA